MASPTDTASEGPTAFGKHFWILPEQLFGQPASTWADYPDMSIGSQNLWLSWDVGLPCCNVGFQVTNFSLEGLAAGPAVAIGFYTPADDNTQVAWGSHLT